MNKVVWVVFFIMLGVFFSLSRTLAQRESDFLKPVINPDFVQAKEILFYDDFRDGIVGKVPDNWEIHSLKNWHTIDSSNEHGTLTTVNNHKVLRIPDGGFEFFRPSIKAIICDTCYLTIEFDYLALDTDKVEMHIDYPYGSEFETACCAIARNGTVNIGYLKNCNTHTPQEHMENRYREYPISGGYNAGVWHHFAASLKNKKMTLCIDRNFVFRDEFVNVKPENINFSDPYVITNLRIAQTKGSNSMDNINTIGKLVTHSIRFEDHSAYLRRESFALIKQMAEWMTKNPLLKIEIDCFPDESGTSLADPEIPVQRANAVKNLLVQYGIASSRLFVRAGGAGDGSGYRHVEFIRL